MNRIKPEEVRDAYLLTGYKLIQEDFVKQDCACALSVCAIAATPKKEMFALLTTLAAEEERFTDTTTIGKRETLQHILNLSSSYTCGFMDGFDGAPRSILEMADVDFEVGYTDGAESLRLCRQETKIEKAPK